MQDLAEAKAKALKLQELHNSVKEQKKRQAEKERKVRVKAFCHRVSLVYNPSLALTFVGVYWYIGLKNAQFI